MTALRARSGYQRLGLVTILGLLTLVVLGGAVRVTDSGLACPDWPLCNGKLIPQGDYHIWLEWTHRLAASVFGLVILAFIVGAVRRYRDRPWVVAPALIAAVALGVQVILGGLTVTEDLDATIVSAHLATAMLIVVLMLVAWLATFVPVSAGPVASRPGRNQDAAPGGLQPPAGRYPRRPASQDERRFASLAVLTALATFALLVLGGYVSSTGAAFFCDGDWPLCNGGLLPEGRNAGLQVSHRYLAAFVALLVLGVWWLAFRRRRRAPALFSLATAVALLFALQIVLGGLLMWTSLDEWSRVLHLVAAALTWGALVAMTALATYAAVRWPSLHQRTPLPTLMPQRVHLGETRR